jgi:hypothetical protein
MSVGAKWGLTGILAVFVAASSVNIHVPFLRHAEGSGTEFGKLARNFHRFGCLKLRFGPLDLSGPRLEDYPDWRHLTMTNRNILPTLYFSMTWGWFGHHEWVFRASLILVGAGNILLFYFLARRVLGAGWPHFAATALFALSPMSVYYTLAAGQYPCSLFMIQVVLLSYFRWRERRSGRRLALFFAWLFVGCNTGWPVYYAALGVGLYEFFLERDRRSPLVWAPVACVGFFGIHLLHLLWIEPDLLRVLVTDARHRIGAEPVSPVAYLIGEARDVAIYHTATVALLAGAWAILAIARRQRADGIILGLLVLGLEEIVFYRWAALHDYLTFPLQPFFALAAARALEGLAVRLPRRWMFGLVGAVAAAWLLQSAYISHRRLTTFGAYEFYYRLGTAINASTRPDEKVLVATHDLKLYTPFYADRYITSYDAKERRLVTELRAPTADAPGEEAVLRWIDSNRARCDVVVATTKELTLKHDRYLASVAASSTPEATDAILRKFQVDLGDSILREELERRVAGGTATRVEHGGFLFYRLR